MQTETQTRRETVRSRTTMSYAFDAAVRNLVDDLVAGEDISAPRIELAQEVAGAVGSDRGRAVPTWTVSKRAEAPAKSRRKRARR